MHLQRSRTLGQAPPAHGAATIPPSSTDTAFTFPAFSFSLFCFPVAEPLCVLRDSTLVTFSPWLPLWWKPALRCASISLRRPQNDPPEAPGAKTYTPRVSSSLYTDPLPRLLRAFCEFGYSRLFYFALCCSRNWRFKGQWLQSAVIVIPVCAELRSLSYRTIAMHGCQLLFRDRGSSLRAFHSLFELLLLYWTGADQSLLCFRLLSVQFTRLHLTNSRSAVGLADQYGIYRRAHVSSRRC